MIAIQGALILLSYGGGGAYVYIAVETWVLATNPYFALKMDGIRKHPVTAVAKPSEC